MIKINLLLARKEKKKVGLGKEFIVLILSIAFLLVLLGLIQWWLGNKRDNTRAQISQTKQEIDRYKSLTIELNKHKEEQKKLQDKLNIISSLKKETGSPAKILDELSIDKPEKLQLESLKKNGSKLGIEGIALDDETIVNFMTNLRKSKLFKSVDLNVSEQIEQNKIKLRKFILSCEIILT